jgi:hypothetical protein
METLAGQVRGKEGSCDLTRNATEPSGTFAMSEQRDEPERWVLSFTDAARPGSTSPMQNRVRILLKFALRSLQIKCVRVSGNEEDHTKRKEADS